MLAARPDLSLALDDVLARALDDGLGSAAAVSIGDGGREVARVARGTTHGQPTVGEPITTATAFDLASLTKPMVTTTLAMLAVTRGRLDLEAPVRRWHPAFANDARIAHLLGHGAGCAPHVRFFDSLWQAGAAGNRQDAHARLVAAAAQTAPTHAPGTQAVYSDLGYVLLGAIVEAAWDAPLDLAFAEAIAAPLGLAAAYRPLADASAGRPDAVPATAAPWPIVATEIDPARGGVVCGVVHDENAHAAGGVAGHAGLFGSIADVAAFAAAMVGLAAGSASPLAISPAVAHSFFTHAAVPGASWRLGWDTASATPGVSHAGDRWSRQDGVGHLGFTGTSIWLDLARGRWAILLTNRVHPSRDGSADGIKALRRTVGDTAMTLLGA